MMTGFGFLNDNKDIVTFQVSKSIFVTKYPWESWDAVFQKLGGTDDYLEPFVLR